MLNALDLEPFFTPHKRRKSSQVVKSRTEKLDWPI